MYIHFEALLRRVKTTPDTPVFNVPDVDRNVWQDVNYAQFWSDIEHVARYWRRTLTGLVKDREIVGVWLRGFTYTDVVTVFSLSRAGYIPQMFSFGLPNASIVLRLLSKYSGKAIVHEISKSTIISDSGTTIPSFVSVDYNSIPEDDIELPSLDGATNEEDVTFIYLSSGSVGGSPKVVPTTDRWMRTIQHKSKMAFAIGNYDSQDVYCWAESFSHSMAICLFQLILHHGARLVQPFRIDFSSNDLKDMICETGINRIIQFTSILRQHLEDAKTDPELLQLLREMRQVTYAGMPLETKVEEWAIQEDIRLTNNYGCTECGQLLSSVPGSSVLFPLPTVRFRFTPIIVDANSDADPSLSSLATLSGDSYSRLIELNILPDSPDLPAAELCTADGGWKSGDLFEEVEFGEGKGYIFRGREDDWIKSFWSERIDTRSIEDNIYTMCGDIILNCIVVGNGRPFPALFVELRDGIMANGASEEDVKKDILKRTEGFREMLYLHERIQDPRMIKSVPAKTLPRTGMKGNIRRHTVEQQFAQELESMYASITVAEVFGNVFGG